MSTEEFSDHYTTRAIELFNEIAKTTVELKKEGVTAFDSLKCLADRLDIDTDDAEQMYRFGAILKTIGDLMLLLGCHLHAQDKKNSKNPN